MDLFLINFKQLQKKINNKKLQSKLAKEMSEKIADIFYNKKTVLLHKEDGTPYFLDNFIKISISHSNGIIALLFDKNNIGVDIEYIINRNYRKILERFKIKNTDISIVEFYQIWTGFEAKYKSKLASIKSFKYNNYICSYSYSTKDILKIHKINIEDYYDKKDFKIIDIKPEEIDFLNSSTVEIPYTRV